jgi:hypothetical protein
MDGKVLKEGSGAYTCFPTSPDVVAKGGRELMCLVKVWLGWADAWMNKKPFEASGTGIGYMLAGDNGAGRATSIPTLRARNPTTNGWPKVRTL